MTRRNPRSPARQASPARRGLQRAGEGTLVLLVVLVPLVVFPPAGDGFALPKWVVGSTLALLSLALLALDRAVASAAAPVDRGLALGAIAVAPAVLVAGVGGLASRHPAQAFDAWVGLAVGALAVAGWSAMVPAARLHAILERTALPGAVLAAIALWQRIAVGGLVEIDPSAALARGADVDRLRVVALVGSPGDLAAFLVIPAILLQDRWRRRQGSAWGGAALVLVVAGALATQTLTAVAALAIGSAVLWGGRLRDRLRHLGHRGLVAVAAAAAAGGAAVAWALGPRLADLFENATAGRLNALLSGRLDGWAVALRIFGEHPWIGAGPGGYQAEFAPAKLAMLADGYRFYAGHVFPTFVDAHNELLEVAAEWGAVGVAAVAFGIFLLVRAALRIPGGAEGARPLAAALFAAVAVLAAASFPFRIAITAFPLALVFAWVFRAGAPGGEGGGA